MSFLQWNCRSLKNKKIWLHQPPFTTSEFWVFQETFLKADDLLSFPNKIFFRTNRNNRTGGGLLIDANFYFWGFQPTPPLLGRKNIYAQKRRILDWLNQSHFSILNTSTPTHITHNFTSSVIDLTLCSAALLNEVYCYVSDCTFESDHLPIVVSWSKLTNATKYLKTIYWNPILRDSNNFLQSIADPTVEIVTEKISHTININTKNKILTNNEYPPWWNIACNNFCQLKNNVEKGQE
ncbi:LINE-1 reverse transcriptase [Caerostris extrusa]|uniref:LINE-1 reverse transcriptase n=1 Tax=Caerostris extrusa TaxID=172846 RepID=A0AAV4VR69_CAEEX|nr:LINE-1 reverse transcriptase [Caerostris extrusa]